MPHCLISNRTDINRIYTNKKRPRGRTNQADRNKMADMTESGQTWSFPVVAIRCYESLPANIALTLFLLFAVFSDVAALDCYKCSSVNGSDPRCHDPFHGNYSDLLEPGCMGGRKHRNGLFPANACVKLTGYFIDDDTLMTIRDCAVDSATLTIDTELTRMSHCGSFEFQQRYVHGCIAACDYDGCNSALLTTPLVSLGVCSLVVTTLTRTM